MKKGATVVYLGGADGGDDLTVGDTYTVEDYSEWRGQVKLEDDTGTSVWVSDACVKEV